MIINSEQEMLNFGTNFAKHLASTDNGVFGGPATRRRKPIIVGEAATAGPIEAIVIELLGDVGAGKTTFARGLAKGLKVKEPVTSPSFTISKSYALENGGRLIHYDFYRLPDPGIMLNDLQENLIDPKNIIIIEWGESITNILPDNHIKIEIKYKDDNSREVIL
jgi:tRNA threonylcarbamoyladenosine biosynthesis protein TsaE